MNFEPLLRNPLTAADFALAVVIAVAFALGISYAKFQGGFTLIRVVPTGAIAAFVGGWLLNHDRISSAVGIPPGLWMWAVPPIIVAVACWSVAERSKAVPAALVSAVIWGGVVRFAAFAPTLFERVKR